MMAAMRAWTAALIAGLGAPLASALFIKGSVIAPCDSPLYCQGDILREIELARPFEDSKTFVDL
jgi:alpha,alpha-trehalase